VTASDLAEYAYCPRAYWYRAHPPPEGPAPASVRARVEGGRFHARALTARYRREQWSIVWWMLIGAGLLLCLLAFLAIGGR
jgi:CRISPR/Cas system-associated exonuclease Cas4 (RecB family)